MRGRSLYWNAAQTSRELTEALTLLGEFYPIRESRGTPRMEFRPDGSASRLSAKKVRGGFEICYGESSQALRAIGALLSGQEEIDERSQFSMVGVMIDCSRNAVPTVEYLKKFLSKIALLGFNALQLYTEDTYQLADEPYFGYMRGAYTREEVEEIDGFASRLGIELIPCLQTLGHLEQILRWPAYRDLRDTDDVMLVDDAKTYGLIEKMIEFWASSVRSRRIHVGMDETHSLGRGRFHDLHGDERHFDIFNRHLSRVVAICQKVGLRPMIWSDMYFRMGSRTNDYYDLESVVPGDVSGSIPETVDLVYWDYYHDSPDFYSQWIERHKQLGKLPLMASGVWAGNKFWYDRHITESIVPPCVEACRKSGVGELIFTMWGDDGLLCDLDSSFAGLAFAAEHTFSGVAPVHVLEAKCRALCDGASYEVTRGISEIERKGIFPASTLWDDPIMNIFLAGVKFRDMEAEGTFFQEAQNTCQEILRLAGKTGRPGSAGDLKLASALASALAAKFALVDALLSAWLAKDRTALKAVLPLISDYGKKLEKFAGAYRAMWLRNYKPFGLETMQIRFAGQATRLRELARRLKDYLSGATACLPELEEIKRVGGVGSTWRYKNVSHGTVIL